MKYIVFFVSLFYSINISAQQKDSIQISEIKIPLCYFYDNNRDDVDGVIRVKEFVGNNNITAYFDLQLGMVGRCSNKSISNYIKNSIQINENTPISLERKSLKLLDEVLVFNLYPERLFYFKRDETQYIVFEIFHLILISSPSWYSYLVFELDLEGEMLDYYKAKVTGRAILKKDVLELIK